jgi:cation diffusion facilitator CzcD-associated flavoprotein CzcO
MLNATDNMYLDDEQTRRKFKNDTDALLATAKKIEGGLNAGMGIKALMPNSAEAKYAKAHVANRMKEFLTDEDIYQRLLPSFALGCRRLTPGNPFMRAVQKSNVTLHRAAVSKATPTSVIGDDGKEVEVDTIICATGFDVNFVPPFPMRGRNGVLLSEKWALVPEGYMGLATPDMPNYFMFQGPTFPVANGSVMGALQAVGNYIVKMIYKMQRERIHSIEPKQDVTDVFNAHAQAWHNGSCWGDRRCRSWYKNPETGRVNAVWPGSSLHYSTYTNW